MRAEPRTALSGDGGPSAGPRAWAALGVLVLPVLLISVDMTVLSFAVPHIGRDLAPDAVQMLWIVDVYSFVLAAVLVTMGAVGDRVGRRRLLVWGAAGFGIASAAAAFAPTVGALIAARALLGLAGATLMPATLSLIRDLFEDARQRKIAIAVWSSALSAGAALGPVLGGTLLEYFWWGSLFLINVPVTVLVLVLVPVLVPRDRVRGTGTVDLASAGLLALAMFPTVYGVKELAAHGVQGQHLALVLLGLCLGALFVRRQLRLADPLLDVRLFRLPRFTVGVSLNFVTLFAMVAALFFLTQYLQITLGITPLHAGLALLPGMLLAIAGSFLAVALVRRAGLAGVLVLGLALMITGFLVLAHLPMGGAAAQAASGFAVLGLGMGLIQSLTNDAVLTEAPPERAGAASAVSETGYELGAALGVAVLGSVLLATYRNALEVGTAVAGALTSTAQSGPAGASEVAEGLPPVAAAELSAAAEAAFLHGIRTTGLVGAAILLVAACLTVLLLRRAEGPGARPGPGADIAADRPPTAPALSPPSS